MEKKSLDFDLKSVVYTKETKVMDYHFETENGKYVGQLTTVSTESDKYNITHCTADVSEKQMVEMPGTSGSPILQEQYVPVGSLAIRDGRFEANQFPLSTKTSAYVNDFQNFIFALTAPKTVE